MPKKHFPTDVGERKKISPPQLAQLWGIATSKVTGWIRAGELPAMNAATRIGGRPRYLIDIQDIKIFESRRAVSVTPTAKKKTKISRNENVTEFF